MNSKNTVVDVTFILKTLHTISVPAMFRTQYGNLKNQYLKILYISHSFFYFFYRKPYFSRVKKCLSKIEVSISVEPRKILQNVNSIDRSDSNIIPLEYTIYNKPIL